MSTVWIQGDLPHSGGKYRPVHGVDTSTGRIEFYADVAYNGWLLYDFGKAKFHDAHLARRDEDVFGLYYDYLTLAVLADATEDAALAAELNAALRAAYARFTRATPGPRAARSPHRSPRHPTATSSTAPSATATSTWPGSGRCARRAARRPARTPRR